jgi:hypothetical protein
MLGDGEFGVIVRSIGEATPGAVRVEGGAENVMLPRLPMELPPPSRASEIVGANSKATTAAVARRREPLRDIWPVTFWL